MLAVDETCYMGQVKPQFQEQIFSKIVLIANTTRSSVEPLFEDIETGYELFHAVVFCPAMVFKVYKFIDRLLSHETKRTIIQTIVHLFHSGTIADQTAVNLAKQFYYVLASSLDLQYGNILLATSTTSKLQMMKRRGLPFLSSYTDLITECLQGTTCELLEDIYQKLGR